MIARTKPYFWAKSLSELISGENSCEWKIWFKAHYQKYETVPRDDDNLAEWEIAHKALLDKLIAEYKVVSELILIEDETKWTIKGTTADLGGKMDLLAVEPNVVVDAKTGKEKSSHTAQIKIYLLAIDMGGLPQRVKDNYPKAPYTGVIAYDGKEVPVAPPDEDFKKNLFATLRRLALNEPKPIPSKFECAFCDIASCTARFKDESVVVKTELF